MSRRSKGSKKRSRKSQTSKANGRPQGKNAAGVARAEGSSALRLPDPAGLLGENDFNTQKKPPHQKSDLQRSDEVPREQELIAVEAADAPSHLEPIFAEKIGSYQRIYRKGFLIAISVLSALILCAMGWIFYQEFTTHALQAHWFSKMAKKMTFELASGESPSVLYPDFGPYDETLGYSLIPQILRVIKPLGFVISQQARLSPEHFEAVQNGLYAQYREKSQAGLTILDRDGTTLFSSLYPQLYYEKFEDIPPLIINTLLFIENRDLLDPKTPYKNPTIDFERLAKASIDYLISQFVKGHDVPGGSTLATQIEKYRHSPEGRTNGVKEKLKQMLSATYRAYLDGPNSLEARKRIVTDYINSVPLGAVRGAGEIRGIGHGLAAWHGSKFQEVNRLLWDYQNNPTTDPEILKQQALAYKEVLSLFLSQRRPAYYLQSNRDALKNLTKKHLGLLRSSGIISEALYDHVVSADLTFRNNMIMFQPERLNFIERKGANSVRIHLLGLFGFQKLYTLDRFDLGIRSTLDIQTQRDITELMQKLKSREFTEAHGLSDHRLLAKGNPADVIYSLTLTERVGTTNVLRVQADNIDGPFNVNEGGKLELGSTAKLRTLVSYLQVIEASWEAFRTLSISQLQEYKSNPQDKLTEWTRQWIISSPDKSLKSLLAAAMERTYSANPQEAFFTGSGIHRFSNFSKDDNGRTVNVREALRKSINLPFIRMMRDIIGYYTARIPSIDQVLTSDDHPERMKYLKRFALTEGRLFLGRFYLQHRGLSADESMRKIWSKSKATPRKIAALDSLVHPLATFEEFQNTVISSMQTATVPEKQLKNIYQEIYKGNYNLQDRGYIAGLHPLELWLIAYRIKNPSATFDTVMKDSVNPRLEAYHWLLTSKDKNKKDRRIKIMIEQEAFNLLHRSWQKLGYPFGSLKPTYATALGSSGDKPAALAELISILSSGGYRYSQSRITELHFAPKTPFETVATFRPSQGTRVLSPELTQEVRTALQSVVENGTAIRLKGVFKDDKGMVLPVGGKTGTGDNRYSIHAPGGRVIESKALSRTATFVFFIGDRFSGSITAYVPSGSAENFDFTSALPVQILKVLAPKLQPLIKRSYEAKQED
jgi:membrane peptidoglycan carboxypeptidase